MSLHEPEPAPEKPTDIVSVLESDQDYRKRLAPIVEKEEPTLLPGLEAGLYSSAELDKLGYKLKIIRMLITTAKALSRK